MQALRLVSRVLWLLLLLSSIVSAEPPSFEGACRRVSLGRFEAAAEELRQLSPERPSPGEEKLLRRAAGRARTFLTEKHSIAERNAARQALCRARSFLPEELPGSEEPLYSLASGRPELIGKATALKVPAAARRVGLRGTVIVQIVVDQEGCVRRPRVLKGLPLGVDAAALAAVRSWTFQPARFSGHPVAVYYVVTASTPVVEKKALD